MIDATLREADQKMAKAVEHAREEFAAIRTGRAHPSMFARSPPSTTGSRRR